MSLTLGHAYESGQWNMTILGHDGVLAGSMSLDSEDGDLTQPEELETAVEKASHRLGQHRPRGPSAAETLIVSLSLR